ncbi:hypothetical protein CDD80_505 [Ophiocordyceps camponoti-rufipedis]|uniref:FAD-binding FR-type domain-containing protein n=1 Tax=Ophiocordyceps camponoti-rufipedis TaxID=2004952 RepID=A0A2C5YHI0_9HYPO|nr:hypothetical protein CDD80_505 [Ophiocordyceps camponoti-rufipedis]
MAENDAAALAAKLAERTKHNVRLMLYFLAAMLFLVVVFSAGHLLRRWRGMSVPLVVRLSRCFRRFALRSCWLVNTYGDAMLVTLYFIANLLIFFIGLDYSGMPMLSNVGSRSAWLALGNLVVVAALVLKFTPLTWLTGRSYDRLNILHRVSGTMTVVWVIIHTGCYCAYFVKMGRAQRLLQKSDVCGIVAGLAMFLLAVSGFLLRKRFYDTFYYLHVSLWILVLVMTALHQQKLDGHAVVILVAVLGGVWLVDRLLRLVSFTIGAVGNSARLKKLPDESTRVLLAKPPLGAVPGSHCFLWVPGVQPSMTHPLTLAGLNPPELIVGPGGGFSESLGNYAGAHAGRPIFAAVEGPYGLTPDPAAYSSVIAIAGGSGITFTLGCVLNMLRFDHNQRVLFVWIVRTTASLEGIRHRLAALQNDPRVVVRLFVTRQPEGMSMMPPSMMEPVATHASSDSDPDLIDSEKAWPGPTMNSDKWPTPPDGLTQALTTSRPSHYNGIPIVYERPDVGAVIRAAIDDTPPQEHALVLGCGPKPLTTSVRNAAASCIRGDGPGVDLEIETFG